MVGTSTPRKSSQPTIKYGAERARSATNSEISTNTSTAPPTCHQAQWLGIGYMRDQVRGPNHLPQIPRVGHRHIGQPETPRNLFRRE